MLHVGNLLDEMVNEEESLKKRLLTNVDKYGQELLKLCEEMSLPPYEVYVYIYIQSLRLK